MDLINTSEIELNISLHTELQYEKRGGVEKSRALEQWRIGIRTSGSKRSSTDPTQSVMLSHDPPTVRMLIKDI